MCDDICMETNLTKRAKYFAHRKHDEIGQIRKYTGEPYWVHVDAVAKIVAEHGGNEFQIAASYLHDTLEDTKTTYMELISQFGIEVTDLVKELTDVYTSESFPKDKRAWRKAKEAERTSKISDKAKLIKLADLNDNTHSIVKHDADFAKTYLREKANMLKGFQNVNKELYAKVEKQLQDSLDSLGLSWYIVRMKEKIIEYYVREVYGNKLGYIKDPADAALIQRLTGKKTIDLATRNTITDLSGNRILFQQVMFA